MKNAILLHLHYQDLWPEFWYYLKDIKDENTDLYVTVHATETEWYNDIKANSTEVFLIENKGADFGGFLYAYNKIKHIDYLTITKLHGKKSLRMEPGSNMPGPKEAGAGEKWRKKLYLPIIGTRQQYRIVTETFISNPNIYIAGSNQHLQITGKDVAKKIILQHSQITWIDNLLDIKYLPREKHISGGMFIASKLYLNKFFKNKELEIYNNSKMNYGLLTAGHHLECAICNCEYFGGSFLGV
jgi:lipopolysaccharide biosynthesis protein